MKKGILLIVLLNISTFMAQQITPKTAFLEKWENSKNYLLEIAEAMPEENYGFKPTEREMSFSEQLLHIKQNMDWLSTSYFTEKEYTKAKKPLHKSKAEIISELKKSFDSVFEIIRTSPDESLQETVTFFAGPKSKLQILNLLQDHVTHHRGQLIVYLNLKDVKPPKYVGW
ncbi:MAG: DinB family protein [Flavobacterium sp.]|nr:MAG: DinB family protein [Flavobacterium sp.]